MSDEGVEASDDASTDSGGPGGDDGVATELGRALRQAQTTRLADPEDPAAPADHSAVDHKWIVRTPDGDEMAATTRLATSWPLLRMYAKRQFHLRYRQSALGIAWTVVQPVLLVGIYGFIFNAILKVDPGDFPYLSLAWIGMTVWMYVQASVQAGTVSLMSDAWLIGRVWFPREIVPLAPVVASLIDLGVATAILIPIVGLQGGTLGIEMVTIPLMLLVLVLWVSAMSVITATITVFFRDMATLVSLALRLLFIATPVMYPANTVPVQYRWMNAVNPFAQVVINLRNVILAHDWPNFRLLGLHALVGAALCWLGLRYLRAVERRMVDII